MKTRDDYLSEFYEEFVVFNGKPKFENLTELERGYLENTLSFSLYHFRGRLVDLCISIEKYFKSIFRIS